MADLMVNAAEAERSRSINPESETPFAESQADTKAGGGGSGGGCEIMQPSTFYLVLSFCHSVLAVEHVRALQGELVKMSSHTFGFWISLCRLLFDFVPGDAGHRCSCS